MDQLHEEFSRPRIHIKPTRGWSSLGLKNLWEYRELLYFLTWRDIKVRYKQTVLGAAWAIIQPFFSMVIFSLFFGKLAHIPTYGVPYPIFSFTALVPWTFFSNGIIQSTNSLVTNSNLIKKVYFPRLIIPISAVLGGLLDFMLAFFILIGLLFYFHIPPTSHLIWLPYLIFLALITSMGVGFWLTALNVQFRDIRYAVPFIVQVWMFASPVVYSSRLLDEPWRTLYGLNPMVGVIDGFRWVFLGGDYNPVNTLLVSSIISLLIFMIGVVYFRRMEKTFADVV